MRKKILVVCSTLVVFFSLTTLAISQISRKVKDDLYSQIELFSYALTTVQSDYVEEIPPKELIYGSLKGMLSTLDPHSQFLTPEEYKELKTETQGKFGGLGIEISMKDGLLTIITPIEDTPAWNSGIKAGDRIVKIEGEVTRDITLSEAVKKLRGKPGTEVNITILREEEFELKEIKIIREIIRIQDVKHVQILNEKIGYIRLTEFREDSAKEFRKALDQLGEEGAESLIVDLRNNPGGLLNVAIRISEEFLPEGKTIVSTKGRRIMQNSISKSRNTDHIVDWPMVILINEGSASGSEILAGAVKDNNRGIVLGTKSFGKGSVQSVIPMPDGSGLRLTTSKYFTPSGTSIHGTGITPDIVVKRIYPPEKEKTEEEKKSKEIFDNIEDKDLKENEELKISKRAEEVRERLLNDNQVQAAMSVLKGIKVYKNFDAPVEMVEEKEVIIHK
ncbi:Carboxyl-terminal protease [hydrothermal vent metagenome]|uniref:Carboxyl-terminal protease n=1 Tax=hydrothermal vent metagenome TaxID=652676 RepID=A0A3B1D453_9ZZZZ